MYLDIVLCDKPGNCVIFVFKKIDDQRYTIIPNQ